MKNLIESDYSVSSITSKIVEAGGQSSGTMELLDITVEEAIQFCYKQDFQVEQEIPNFRENFERAQQKARKGRTKRKNMPVITDNDVKAFQRRLEQGKIDIRKPFAPSTEDNSDPFPEGLRGTRAQEFLQRGLEQYDGAERDDVVNVQIRQEVVGNLKPIQEQIYFDKSMGSIIDFGVQSSIDFISGESFFILSSDNFIIDGHHRMLSGLLLNPSMKINGLSIDLEIETLLPLARAYGDAIGNQRNR